MMGRFLRSGCMMAVLGIGVGMISSPDAKACGSGSGTLVVGLMAGGLGIAASTVTFTTMDLVAVGEGRGRAYGIAETVVGGLQAALLTGLSIGMHDSGGATLIGGFALANLVMMLHGIATIANPHVAPVENRSASSLSVAPFVLDDRRGLAYGLGVGSRF